MIEYLPILQDEVLNVNPSFFCRCLKTEILQFFEILKLNISGGAKHKILIFAHKMHLYNSKLQ